MVSASRAATDTRHRIRQPNSRPRTVVVAGLGEGGRRLVAALALRPMPNVRILPVPPPSTAAPREMLERIAEGADDLARAFDGADMIFVVCEPGDDVGFAAPVARVARHRGLLVTGVVIGRTGDEANADLDALRRACDLIVISADDASLHGMLDALR
jgi:NAD(P)H-hydrate repair Nnr-like enzyme with NAD(P)H-hydrate epimerase domain